MEENEDIVFPFLCYCQLMLTSVENILWFVAFLSLCCASFFFFFFGLSIWAFKRQSGGKAETATYFFVLIQPITICQGIDSKSSISPSHTFHLNLNLLSVCSVSALFLLILALLSPPWCLLLCFHRSRTRLKLLGATKSDRLWRGDEKVCTWQRRVPLIP